MEKLRPKSWLGGWESRLLQTPNIDFQVVVGMTTQESRGSISTGRSRDYAASRTIKCDNRRSYGIRDVHNAIARSIGTRLLLLALSPGVFRHRGSEKLAA